MHDLFHRSTGHRRARSMERHPARGRRVRPATGLVRTAVLVMLAALAVPIAPAAARTRPAAPATAARGAALGSHTAAPSTVTVAGSLQSEAGCSADWQPDCASTHMTYDSGDDVWQLTLALPAGSYEYKAALNDAWTENYGAGGVADGANVTLSLADAATVKFYYDHKTHWITSTRNTRIVTSPGSFQSELGCPGDWQPDCLRSWLEDPDGDGTFTFVTSAIPAGGYEGKAAISEAWDENYGAGGTPGGANIAFTVPAAGSTTTFSFVSATNVLTITSVAPPATHRTPGDIEWSGLRHDSRDLLYRTPGGAVPAGTPVRIRLRSFHDDITGATLRLYDINANGQRLVPMTLDASDVPCYQPTLADETCDFWVARLTEPVANDLWYRFIVQDDADTDYYADDTNALDGGLGRASDDPVDDSYALTVYAPGFTAPGWARNAVVYQIFPDRFRNGDPMNDPQTGDVRYDDPVVAHPWGARPEGYCRNYQGTEGTACGESPRGRDYQGGDLQGVIDKLDYLKGLGVNTLYFNPIFFARSNHRYDTADYYRIDPYLGDNALFRTLATRAKARGMRIVLDGVFNHMSSDSPRFDRYGHFPATGACESTTSPWRGWFRFRLPAGSEPAPCAGPGGPDSMYYEGWFGFDSIPVLDKTVSGVRRYFVTDPNSVTRFWLDQGAAGWRLDVMGDPSFPAGYWETFRSVVKGTDAQALIISETWQKDSTLLRMVRGQRADSTMNYRLRDAVLGLLAPQPFDSKGFPGSGSPITARQFASRMEAIYEDYAPAADRALMNLLDSHDTERALWTLTPGEESRAGRELDAANLAQGKRRLRLASLIQFTVPGMPTVYYGDEVGVTGDDDPDDRRAYPWTDTGGTRDTSLLRHYKSIAALRTASPALRLGTFETLVADNVRDVVAYGMFAPSQAGVVAINRSSTTKTVTIPLSQQIGDGVRFHRAYGVYNATTGGDVIADSDRITVTLGPLSGLVLLTDSGMDLEPLAAPQNLRVTSEGDANVALAWDAVVGAASYNVYRSPVAGGGFVNIGGVMGTTFSDSDVENGREYHYAVEAVSPTGFRSLFSNEAVGLPHLLIGWANLQYPPDITHTISTTNRTPQIYGQVWIDGHTSLPGATPSLRAQVGWGPDGTQPTSAGWRWVEASFNTDAGNNDEFKATLLPDRIGAFDYVYRYTTTNGRDWLYADLGGPEPDATVDEPGALTVQASDDTTAPAIPTGLRFTSASPAGIDLDWDDVTGDPTLFGYEVFRRDALGTAYRKLARVTASAYSDTDVVENHHYLYVVRSVDTSFNRSGYSSEIEAVAALRDVDVTFSVTVSASTDGTGRSVYIAGFLDRLYGGLPQWDPGGVVLTRVDATHWTITLSGQEGTQIEYKYTLGSWDYVEKDTTCGEVANRQLTLAYGASGQQTVSDTVDGWRNVAPCGN